MDTGSGYQAGEVMENIDVHEFYAKAIKPDFPNDMLFELSVEGEGRADEDRTFSKEGVQGLVRQMEAFITARIFATWEKYGQPPKDLRVAIVLSLGSNDSLPPTDAIQDCGLPWYRQVDAIANLTRVDGTNRLGVDNE